MMKKITLIGLFCLVIVFTGCNKTTNNQNGGPNYEGTLVIQGVGPEIAMEPTVDEGTLVLRGNFEYHSDHVFLKAGKWEDFFESENEYLPGNTVKFKGYVTALDAAAGNHYYDVVNADELKVVSYPDVNEIKEILESYNYCETDDDCGYIAGKCPFGCYIFANKKFINSASYILDNYFDMNGVSCVYSCIAMDGLKCDNYKCKAVVNRTVTNTIGDETGNINGNNEDNIEHTNNTLIISMVEGTDQSMIDKYLLKKYNMEIMYNYENFNTIAVKFDHGMTEEELDKLISEIEKLGFVLSVEKDYVSSINN